MYNANPNPNVPWTDCRVAFDVRDVGALWIAAEGSEIQFPPGWRLVAIDASCPNPQAVFRVELLPTESDGRAVYEALRAFN